jgi:hypothetical protein
MGSSQIVNVQHMVKWIQEKPEVIAYVRGTYTDDALPKWVGRLKGNVNYREFLLSKGVELPAMVDDSGSMDDGSGEDNAEEGDIAQGTIPVQGSAIGDVDPKSPSLTGTHGKSQAVSHGHSPQESSPVMGEVTEKSPPVTVNESREEPSPATGLGRAQLPKAIVVTKSVKVPVKIADESEGVIQQSPAREKLVEELKKLQTHDPTIVPMEGGEYGKDLQFKELRGVPR